MYDGLKIFIPAVLLTDIKKNMKHLERIGENTYVLKVLATSFKHKNLRFKFTETGMTIEGSLMYSKNGNGIQFDTHVEQELFLGAIGAMLQVDIMKAEVKYFEYGVTLNTPFNFQEFQHNHVGVPNMFLSLHKPKIKIFGDDLRSVKIYDAGYNAKKKVSADKRKELVKAGIFDPKGNHIKYEVKYHRPKKYFNKDVVLLQDLFDPALHSMINTDIVTTYDSMIKTGFSIDTSISCLTTEDLLYITLKKVEMEVGTIDIEKKLLETLHEHRKFYTASQKCYRKKTIKKLGATFKPGINPTDISSLIKTQLALS